MIPDSISFHPGYCVTYTGRFGVWTDDDDFVFGGGLFLAWFDFLLVALRGWRKKLLVRGFVRGVFRRLYANWYLRNRFRKIVEFKRRKMFCARARIVCARLVFAACGIRKLHEQKTAVKRFI